MRSLVPLIALSLLLTLLLTQNTVTLAYPSFQSPVQSPIQPPAETPVAPPAETPAVPPGETPVPPPSGEGTPPASPEATPGEEAPDEVAPPTTEGEEESSPTGAVSPAVLIDTCVVGLSSVWLCCGGFALVVFLLLVLASFLLQVS